MFDSLRIKGGKLTSVVTYSKGTSRWFTARSRTTNFRFEVHTHTCVGLYCRVTCSHGICSFENTLVTLFIDHLLRLQESYHDKTQLKDHRLEFEGKKQKHADVNIADLNDAIFHRTFNLSLDLARYDWKKKKKKRDQKGRTG